MGIDNIVYLANKYKSCNFYTSHMDDNTRVKLNNLNLDNVNILQDRDIYIF